MKWDPFNTKKISQLDSRCDNAHNRIENLNSLNSKLSAEISKLEKKVFTLENPPKFKISDVVGRYTVVSERGIKPSIARIAALAFKKHYENHLPIPLENKPSYDVFNSATKKIERISEDELFEYATTTTAQTCSPPKQVIPEYDPSLFRNEGSVAVYFDEIHKINPSLTDKLINAGNDYINDVENLKERLYRLEHPPKFKVGDKIKNHTIIEKPKYFIELKIYGSDGLGKKKAPSLTHYTYLCFNTKGKYQVTFTEDELIKLTKSKKK